MKRTLCVASLLAAGLLAARAWAQQVDIFLGVGTARAGSNGQKIDTFGDGTLYSTPSLGGTFSDFGASVFIGPQFGASWTMTWRAAHDYAGLGYRPYFNTFDAVFQPTKLRTHRAWPEFRAGLGFAHVGFDYDDSQLCAQVPGCPSTNHFLAHAGVAERFYLVRNLFLRPAVDVQYIKHFFPFGRNWVPNYSMSLGYSFGRE